MPEWPYYNLIYLEHITHTSTLTHFLINGFHVYMTVETKHAE